MDITTLSTHGYYSLVLTAALGCCMSTTSVAEVSDITVDYTLHSNWSALTWPNTQHSPLHNATVAVTLNSNATSIATTVPWRNGTRSTPPTVGYCPAYCDLSGKYNREQWCPPNDSRGDVYCCQEVIYISSLYCCSDSSKETEMTKSARSCPQTSWWYYQWRVLISLLVSLVVLLFISVTGYYCCEGDRAAHRRRSRRRRARIAANRQDEIDPYQAINLHFNPDSPHAFAPPDYASLPKDPPTYQDIFSIPEPSPHATESPSDQNTGQPREQTQAAPIDWSEIVTEVGNSDTTENMCDNTVERSDRLTDHAQPQGHMFTAEGQAIVKESAAAQDRTAMTGEVGQTNTAFISDDPPSDITETSPPSSTMETSRHVENVSAMSIDGIRDSYEQDNIVNALTEEGDNESSQTQLGLCNPVYTGLEAHSTDV